MVTGLALLSMEPCAAAKKKKLSVSMAVLPVYEAKLWVTALI